MKENLISIGILKNESTYNAQLRVCLETNFGPCLFALRSHTLDVPFQTRKFGARSLGQSQVPPVSNFKKSPQITSLRHLQIQLIIQNDNNWHFDKSDVFKILINQKITDTSFESEVSNDYAIPPDASVDSLAPPSMHSSSNTMESPRRGGVEKALEKSGYLTKVIHKIAHIENIKMSNLLYFNFQLGGKIKSWHKRYFVLKTGVLSYWKSQVPRWEQNCQNWHSLTLVLWCWNSHKIFVLVLLYH